MVRLIFFTFSERYKRTMREELVSKRNWSYRRTINESLNHATLNYKSIKDSFSELSIRRISFYLKIFSIPETNFKFSVQNLQIITLHTDSAKYLLFCVLFVFMFWKINANEVLFYLFIAVFLPLRLKATGATVELQLIHLIPFLQKTVAE